MRKMFVTFFVLALAAVCTAAPAAAGCNGYCMGGHCAQASKDTGMICYEDTNGFCSESSCITVSEERVEPCRTEPASFAEVEHSDPFDLKPAAVQACFASVTP